MADLKKELHKYIELVSAEWDCFRRVELEHSAKNVSYKEDEILRKVAPEFEQYIDVLDLVVHLQKRNKYIERGQLQQLKCFTNSKEQSNMLIGLLADLATGRKGVISDLLLSVLDSYETSEGGKALFHHWNFAQILLDSVFMSQELPKFNPDLTQAVQKLKEVVCDEMKVINFARTLGLEDTLFSSISEVCEKWLEVKPDVTFSELVSALLTTHGMGRHVTGLCPPCRCNPPFVHNWFKSLPCGGWKLVANHFGFFKEEISFFFNTYYSDQERIPQIFLRFMRIPNIGSEFEKVFKHIAEVTKLNDLPKDTGISKADVAGPGATPDPSPPIGDVAQMIHFSLQTTSAADQTWLLHVKNVKSCEALQMPGTFASNHAPKTLVLPHEGQGETVVSKQQDDTEVVINSAVTQHQHSAEMESSSSAGSSALNKRENSVVEEQVSTTSRDQDDCEVGELASESENTLFMRQATDLLDACYKHDWGLATALLNSSVRNPTLTEACHENGKTALHFACEEGLQELVELLVNCGADVTKLTRDDLSVLNYPKVLKNEEILKRLLLELTRRKSELVNGNVNHGTPGPLLLVCNEGDELCGSAELLLGHGAFPNGSQRAYSRPLIVASERGFLKLVELLVARGADLNLQDKAGNTALLQACRTRHFNVAQFLLDQPEININRSDKSGTTPLFEAISANNFQFVEKLLKKRARVNATRQVSNEMMMGSVEETPLAHACARGLEKIVMLLIDQGAHLNFKCSDTVSPIGFAIIGRKMSIVRKLLKCNSLDTSIYGLSSAIIISVKIGNNECTKLLVDRLGGLEKAIHTASENQLEELTTHLTMYMSSDPNVLGIHDQLSSKPSEQMNPLAMPYFVSQADGEDALEQFSHLCVRALRRNEEHNNVTLQDLAITAGALHPENPALAIFFTELDSRIQYRSLVDLRRDFLFGLPSPLTFVISQNVLTAEMFYTEAKKHFDNQPEYFYDNLVAAFHRIQHGENLPNSINGVLRLLFEARFQINLRIGGAQPLIAPGSEASALPQGKNLNSVGTISHLSTTEKSFPGHGIVLGGGHGSGARRVPLCPTQGTYATTIFPTEHTLEIDHVTKASIFTGDSDGNSSPKECSHLNPASDSSVVDPQPPHVDQVSPITPLGVSSASSHNNDESSTKFQHSDVLSKSVASLSSEAHSQRQKSPTIQHLQLDTVTKEKRSQFGVQHQEEVSLQSSLSSTDLGPETPIEKREFLSNGTPESPISANIGKVLEPKDQVPNYHQGNCTAKQGYHTPEPERVTHQERKKASLFSSPVAVRDIRIKQSLVDTKDHHSQIQSQHHECSASAQLPFSHSDTMHMSSDTPKTEGLNSSIFSTSDSSDDERAESSRVSTSALNNSSDDERGPVTSVVKQKQSKSDRNGKQAEKPNMHPKVLPSSGSTQVSKTEGKCSPNLYAKNRSALPRKDTPISMQESSPSIVRKRASKISPTERLSKNSKKKTSFSASSTPNLVVSLQNSPRDTKSLLSKNRQPSAAISSTPLRTSQRTAPNTLNTRSKSAAATSFYKSQKSAPAGKEVQRVKPVQRSKSEVKAVCEEVIELRMNLAEAPTADFKALTYRLHHDYSHYALKILCGSEVIRHSDTYIRTDSDKDKFYKTLTLIIDGIRDDYPDLNECEIDVIIYGVVLA